MLNKNILGERIRELRISKNESQQTLAEYLSIGKSAVSMIESGKRAASIEILISIADHFNVSLDYLVGRSDDPSRR